MTDLAVLVPSRGRPQNVARLIEACEKTCRAETLLSFGFDEDDPLLGENLAETSGRTVSTVRPRMGLAAWTNELAGHHQSPPFLASIGDDMVPLTDGWDEILIEACDTYGMAYPNDRRRDDIPEAIVMSSAVVRALGWMCEPSLHHWFVDNVWADLGRAAECLAYCPNVIVEHRHPNVPGGDPPDGTYSDAAERYAADLAAYQRWRFRRMAADVGTVRRVRGAAAGPVGHAGSPA